MASELPRFYYHDHFSEMLSFVRRHYAHALRCGHQAFIDNFLQLDTMAQRLYVRLANRRAKVFAIEKLRYPEIGPLAEPLRTLHAGDWTGTPVVDDYPQVLACLTKPQLHAAACMQLAGISSRSRKSELIEILLDNVTASCMLNALGVDRFVVKRRTDVLGYLMFLYFGDTHERLEKFAMRDLGLVRTHTVADAFEPRFDNREDALQAWYFASRLEQLKPATAQQRQGLVMEAASWPEPSCRVAAELRARLAYRLARQLERSGLDDEAIAMYHRGSSMECGERLVRLLLRTGRREAARRQLEQCLLTPRSEAPARNRFAPAQVRQPAHHAGYRRVARIGDHRD